jgi:hypothetical protein
MIDMVLIREVEHSGHDLGGAVFATVDDECNALAEIYV